MADFETRLADVDDDAELHDVYETMRRADAVGRDAMPFWSEHEFVPMVRAQVPGVRRHVWGAFEDGRVVGAGMMLVPLLDNVDKAYFEVFTAPEHRRRGVGTALEAFARGLAGEERRPTTITETRVPAERREDHAHRLFAESLGYRLANTEVGRRLDLPVDAALLDTLAADAAPHHADYRIETYVDDIPDRVLPSFLELLGLLALEAPTGELDLEEEVVTAESFRERQRLTKEQGRTVYTTVALDSDGQAVADSVLAVPSDDTGNVYQWATLVRREHRGHRLGLATKVANLRAVQAAHPDRQRVWTTNAEVNAIMVAINERLGFVPVELLLEFQRKDDSVVPLPPETPADPA